MSDTSTTEGATGNKRRRTDGDTATAAAAGQNALASAFDTMFGSGGGLEMPGEAFGGGMADDDLELLFDPDNGMNAEGDAGAEALNDFGDLFGGL